MSDKIDIEKVIHDFDSLDKSKKKNAMLTRLVIYFSFGVVIAVLIWGYSVTQTALNTIVVVERSGEYLKITAESNENLFVTLAKTSCSHATHYLNSFDRLNLKENQAKALFYVNRNDAQRVFDIYKDQRAYLDALEGGIIFRTEIEEFKLLQSSLPCEVEFTSILSITRGKVTDKFIIHSKGVLNKSYSQFPENVTGMFFESYEQVIRDYNETR